ncbi:TorF family putative porin [Paraburkholderia ferrariae]|uniref:TorF family putative porin n=1 Tax=Paraburkholderia ferrariae TaxID=386056 RepID=UPI0005A8BFA7|nr:TorF family putative porin [Paraburkholderia ferrariae]
MTKSTLSTLCLGLILSSAFCANAHADDVDIATYSVVPSISLLSDVRTRGVSDSLGGPGAKLSVEVAHESGLVAIAEINNVSREEFPNGNGTDITFAGGWRFGNPDKWHFGIGLATEIFPGANFDSPQSFDFVNQVPANVTSTNYNTDYVVLELGYDKLQGRVISVISKDYRGANTGGVCGAMLQFDANPTQALECYARGNHGSRGTLLFDLDYDYAIRGDTTLKLHTGYQKVANFPEADSFDYSIGITHVRWGFEWNLSWVAAIVRTPALYAVQDGSSVKSTSTPTIFASVTRKF